MTTRTAYPRTQLPRQIQLIGEKKPKVQTASETENRAVEAVIRRMDEKVKSIQVENSHEKNRAKALLRGRKLGVKYDSVPGVDELSICETPPNAGWNATGAKTLSPGLVDPLLEAARMLKVKSDFKPLSDVLARRLSKDAWEALKKKAAKTALSEQSIGEQNKAYLSAIIAGAYETPCETAPSKLAPARLVMRSGDEKLDAAFTYTENTWENFLKISKPAAGGSLLDKPYDGLHPSLRFDEQYDWDTFFGVQGLIATGRLPVAQMQVENLLTFVRNYGMVPNGGRDYYLSRSQPPFLSSMVSLVYQKSMRGAGHARQSHLKKWLGERAYPLIKAEYENFWMTHRVRSVNGMALNHHSDDVNLPRPERHSADEELELGIDYFHTRASAESGFDFTDAVRKEGASIAGPLLNSMLFKTEKDLATMAKLVGRKEESTLFTKAASKRRIAMQKCMWNPERAQFEAFHLERETRMGVLTAETFVPLFAGVATRKQARKMVLNALPRLERAGGVMASELTESTHQWDGTNIWAPIQVMTIDGLEKYGYKADSKRLAGKWAQTVAGTHHTRGGMYERYDGDTCDLPEEDGTKYPIEKDDHGFLWTNGSFAYVTIDKLGYRTEEKKTQSAASNRVAKQGKSAVSPHRVAAPPTLKRRHS